jgi:hypothetical protein
MTLSQFTFWLWLTIAAGMFSIVFLLYRLFRAGDHQTIVDESEGDYWNPNNDGHLRAKMPEKPRRLKALGGRP